MADAATATVTDPTPADADDFKTLSGFKLSKQGRRRGVARRARHGWRGQGAFPYKRLLT